MHESAGFMILGQFALFSRGKMPFGMIKRKRVAVGLKGVSDGEINTQVNALVPAKE